MLCLWNPGWRHQGYYVTEDSLVQASTSDPPQATLWARLKWSQQHPTPGHSERVLDEVKAATKRSEVATKIMKFLIDNFGVSNLFGRDNYEFYARITGRILKVEEDWIFSFRYPPDTLVSRQLSLEAEKTWLQYECDRWGLKFNLEAMSHQEESQSTPALIHVPEGYDPTAPSTSLGIIPENNLLESYTRLSISLEENGLFKGSSRSSSSSTTTSHHMTLDELRAVNRYAESTKSLSYLPQVHERQTARMRTRSEWFLTPTEGKLMSCSIDSDPTSIHVLRGSNRSSSGNIGAGLSASAESLKRPSIVRRSSSRDKSRHHAHRSSSRRKNKENGAKQPDRRVSPCVAAPRPDLLGPGTVTQQDCTEMDVQTFHVTLTYKPRI
uniref:Uncharacterized protein n=1 Tax=Timema shepardi TaxID=629360 RepID=A0A7R9G274_TIMSH|nr:unnamed protein product [Timema shepardi]